MAQWNFGEAIAQILANQKEQSFREMQRQDAIKAREEDREFRDLSMQFDKERANEANRQFQQTFTQNAEEAKLRKLQADRAYRADTYDQSELEALISANPKLKGVLGGIKFDEQGNADTRAVDAIVALNENRDKEARDTKLALQLEGIRASQNSAMKALQMQQMEENMARKRFEDSAKALHLATNAILPKVIGDKSYAFMEKGLYKSEANIPFMWYGNQKNEAWQKQKESNSSGLLNYVDNVAKPLMDLYLEGQKFGLSNPTLESEILNVATKLNDAYSQFDSESPTLSPTVGKERVKAKTYNELMRYKPLLQQYVRMQQNAQNDLLMNEMAKAQGRTQGKLAVTGKE